MPETGCESFNHCSLILSIVVIRFGTWLRLYAVVSIQQMRSWKNRDIKDVTLLLFLHFFETMAHHRKIARHENKNRITTAWFHGKTGIAICLIGLQCHLRTKSSSCFWKPP